MTVDLTEAMRKKALQRVGATLAEPLRRAFDAHCDEHGCGTGDHTDPRYVGGFSNCPEAWHLFKLLPLGDAVITGWELESNPDPLYVAQGQAFQEAARRILVEIADWEAK